MKKRISISLFILVFQILIALFVNDFTIHIYYYRSRLNDVGSRLAVVYAADFMS
jgi:hypothetical protein